MDFNKVNSPTEVIKEEHGYFQRDRHNLFYASYMPPEKPETSILFCAPFGEEKVRSLRVFVSFARTLALSGVGALLFDYYGDGDSEGFFEGATYEDRLFDIDAAASFLKDNYAPKKIGFLGLRYGSTLAAIKADDLNPDFLILWEPIIDCSKYFYDLLRTNLASQMLIDGKVTVTRDDLIEKMEKGELISVEGYLIGRDFFFRARENSLTDKEFSYDGKSIIVPIVKNVNRIKPELSALQESLKNCELTAVLKEFEWEKTDIWQPSPPQLFETTLDFMEKNGFLRRNL
jgi:alpha/beta superfamily hydrolase